MAMLPFLGKSGKSRNAPLAYHNTASEATCYADSPPRPRSVSSRMTPAKSRCSSRQCERSTTLSTQETPRRAVLRSRVLTQRNPNGGVMAMPAWSSVSTTPGLPQPLLERVPVSSDSSIPVTVGMPKKPTEFARPKVDNVAGKVLLAAKVAIGHGRSARSADIWSPVMTEELHADLKQRLDAVSQFCQKGDFPTNPRRVDIFFQQLTSICGFMQMHLTDKSYRRQYNFTKLKAFFRQIPDAQELVASMGELPTTGFLVFTVLLLLNEHAWWEFNFNSMKYKTCDCAEKFGVNCCLVPMESDGVKVPPKARGAAWSPEDKQRLEKLRETEKHFPAKLFEFIIAGKSRMLNLAKQIPKKLEEFLLLSLPPSTKMWERFVTNFASHVTVFDQYYTRFECLYLSLVDKMLSNAMEPLQAMTQHSERLIQEPSESFSAMQTSMFCQRLGLLNRHVDFGGIKLTEFDPTLLAKAKRILLIETYAEVQDMARTMIQRFEVLCKLLGELSRDSMKPEISENSELKYALLDLEEIWDQCQYILAQKALDFIDELILHLDSPEFDTWMRWKIKMAIVNDRSKTQEFQAEADIALFSTLPILIYLKEMRKDVDAQDEGKPPHFSNFLDLFCPDKDRYERLRAEIGKFDKDRFNRLYKFVLSGGTICETQQMLYFENIYKQLREAAAFNLGERHELNEREVYARSQWICMHEIVHKVAPSHIFPTESPKKKAKSPKRLDTKSGRMLTHSGNLDEQSEDKRVSPRNQLQRAQTKSMGTRTIGDDGSKSPVPSQNESNRGEESPSARRSPKSPDRFKSRT